MNDIQIPSKYCNILIGKLNLILPELQANALDKHKFMLNDNFIIKFETKLYKDPRRFMLFDFIKDLIHETLLKDKV